MFLHFSAARSAATFFAAGGDISRCGGMDRGARLAARILEHRPRRCGDAGHLLARPVPGVGIALAVFVPPLSAVAIALLISRWQSAALSYTGGSVGRLIGADLLTLNKVQGLRAPVASLLRFGRGRRIDHPANFGDLVRREAAAPGVLVNERLVLGEIDAKGFVGGDVALDIECRGRAPSGSHSIFARPRAGLAVRRCRSPAARAR